MSRAEIAGSCHCGNIRFMLDWPGAATEIKIRQCGCTFCRKRNGSWTSHPDARLKAEIEDASRVTRYRFGTETADFVVCARCGIVPFVVSRIDGTDYAVVNVHAFDDVDTDMLSVMATDFDGEDTASRLDRRRKNWISSVEISTSRQSSGSAT